MYASTARGGALALLIGWAIADPTRISAQTPATIRVKAPAGRIEAQSGGAWKSALVVSNQGTTRVRLAPRLQLPSGWRPLLAPDYIDVPAGASSILVLSAILPPTAGAATYPVIFDLQSDRGALIRRDTLNVVVLPRRFIRISTGAGPRYARLDTTITVDFVVRNEGNVPLALDLRARAIDANAAVRDSSHLAINAGGVRYVAVVVGPATRGGTQVVELQARARGVSSNFTGVFEVLRVAEATVSRAVLPLTLRMRASADDVTPAELSGGFVGPRDTFDLMVRRPGEIGAQFGERDEYRASWSGRHANLVAGDIVPGNTPIRDSYEMLTGGDATVRFGRITANTYLGRDRLLETNTGERGLSLAVRALRALSVGVGAVERTGSDSGAGRTWRAFTSIGTGQIAPLVQAEVNSGKDGISAYGVRAQRRFERAWFDFSLADVSSAAPARERGSSRASLNVGAQLTRHLSVRAWAGEYQMDTLPFRPYSLHSRSHSAGFTFGPLTTEYRRDEREALIQGVAYASNEESERANVGRAFGKATVTAGAQVGRSYDPTLSEAVAPFQRYTSSTFLNVSPRWSVGGSLEYYTRKAFVSTQHYSGSLSTSARFSSTRVELHGSLFHVLFPTVASYSTLNARIEQALPAGQTISLRARAFTTTSGTPVPHPVVFFLEYGMPIHIPLPGVGPRPVRARVVEAGSGRAVRGALVRMGEYTAITNGDGRVTFAPTAVLNQISVEGPTASAPLVVDAPELENAMRGRRDEVTISVGEGARVSGRVTRYDRVTRDSLAPSGGIANVHVTLSRGADTLNLVTRDDGDFDFRQLPPGEWTISVSGGEIPAAYGFERSSALVAVQPGRSATIEFRVLSRADAANLEDGGALSLPKPEPRNPPRPRQQSRPPR